MNCSPHVGYINVTYSCATSIFGRVFGTVESMVGSLLHLHEFAAIPLHYQGANMLYASADSSLGMQDTSWALVAGK